MIAPDILAVEDSISRIEAGLFTAEDLTFVIDSWRIMRKINLRLESHLHEAVKILETTIGT